jgi:26S proteasome regulatory subunit T3
MSLSPEVDLDSLIVRNEPLSGAVIAAIMQEAGLRAVRKNRYNIIQTDLEDAYAAQVKTGQESDRYALPCIQICLTTSSNYCVTGSNSTGRLCTTIGSYEVEIGPVPGERIIMD